MPDLDVLDRELGAKPVDFDHMDKLLGARTVDFDALDSDLGARLPVAGETADNPLNEIHPEVSRLDRALIKHLQTDPAQGERLLRDRGFQVKHVGGFTGQHDYAIRRPGERFWRKVDPSGWQGFGELAQDTGEFLQDLAEGTLIGAGTAVGAAAGAPAAPVTGGLSVLGGGAAGAGLTSAGISGVKSTLGSLAGLTVTPEEAVRDAVTSGVVGAATVPAGALLGAAVKPVVKSAIPAAKAAAKVAPETLKALKPELGEAVAGVAGAAGLPLGPVGPALGATPYVVGASRRVGSALKKFPAAYRAAKPGYKSPEVVASELKEAAKLSRAAQAEALAELTPEMEEAILRSRATGRPPSPIPETPAPGASSPIPAGGRLEIPPSAVSPVAAAAVQKGVEPDALFPAARAALEKAAAGEVPDAIEEFALHLGMGGAAKKELENLSSNAQKAFVQAVWESQARGGPYRRGEDIFIRWKPRTSVTRTGQLRGAEEARWVKIKPSFMTRAEVRAQAEAAGFSDEQLREMAKEFGVQGIRRSRTKAIPSQPTGTSQWLPWFEGHAPRTGTPTKGLAEMNRDELVEALFASQPDVIRIGLGGTYNPERYGLQRGLDPLLSEPRQALLHPPGGEAFNRPDLIERAVTRYGLKPGDLNRLSNEEIVQKIQESLGHKERLAWLSFGKGDLLELKVGNQRFTPEDLERIGKEMFTPGGEYIKPPGGSAPLVPPLPPFRPPEAPPPPAPTGGPRPPPPPPGSPARLLPLSPGGPPPGGPALGAPPAPPLPEQPANVVRPDLEAIGPPPPPGRPHLMDLFHGREPGPGLHGARAKRRSLPAKGETFSIAELLGR